MLATELFDSDPTLPPPKQPHPAAADPGPLEPLQFGIPGNATITMRRIEALARTDKAALIRRIGGAGSVWVSLAKVYLQTNGGCRFINLRDLEGVELTAHVPVWLYRKIYASL